MKISCSSWSFHRTIETGKLDQLAWIEKCAQELELDGVELLDVHFPGIAKDYLQKLKKRIIDLSFHSPFKPHIRIFFKPVYSRHYRKYKKNIGTIERNWNKYKKWKIL